MTLLSSRFTNPLRFKVVLRVRRNLRNLWIARGNGRVLTCLDAHQVTGVVEGRDSHKAVVA